MASLDPVDQHALQTPGWDAEPQLSPQWETLQRETRATLGTSLDGSSSPHLGRRLCREKWLDGQLVTLLPFH